MDFEWDADKEVANIKKHGVSFVETVESFFDPQGFQLVDEKHSLHEPRFFWVGRSGTGRILTTRFTRRGSVVRIIGSGEWREFRRLHYERTSSKEP